MIVEYNGEKTLAVFNKRKNRFDARAWKEYAGLDAEKGKVLAMKDIGACDRQGCVAKVKGRVIAVSEDPIGLNDDCARADPVIALYPATKKVSECCVAELIDRRAVWGRGAHALSITKAGGLLTKSVNDLRGDRPWAK